MDCVQFLKEAGCNVSTPSNEGITPLSAAAAAGHSDCVRFLKEAEQDQQRQATEEADRMMMLLLEEESEAGCLPRQAKKDKGKKNKGTGPLLKSSTAPPQQSPALAMDTDLSDEAIVDILSQVLLAEGIDWSSVSPARLRTMLAHETGGSSKVSEKRMKGVKAAAVVASALSRNVAAVQGTMQVDDGAAAEEEKERLRVQRKTNKQKRRDQSRQKSAVESAEPGSGAPDIDSDKQECDKQSVAVGGAGASIHHLGASDAPPVTAARSGLTVPASEDGAEANEQEVCTICFDKPPTAQLCHINGQSCQCCCGDCGDRLKAEGLPCPMCRMEIVVVIKQNFKHSVRAMA